MNITLTPAYGRDYKNKASAIKDLHEEKDFILMDISSPYYGKPINITDLMHMGYKAVNIRYSNLSKIAVIEL